MTSTFQRLGPGPPAHICAEPQKDMAPDKVLHQGSHNRPFSDDELKQAFNTFDLDKNRFVGAKELSALLRLIGEKVTDREIDEMIRLCDSDGDGQVTFDEFHRLMSQSRNAPPALPARQQLARKSAGAGRGQGKKVGSDYKAKAAQGGGQDATFAQPSDALAQPKPKTLGQPKAPGVSRGVTVETLVKKLSGGLTKIKPSQIKKVYKRFQDIDTDGSGAIEYPEFIAALDMDDGPTAQKMFKVFDMDGSGQIELKEFIVVLSRYTSAAQSEKMKFAFMMFDEDGSGFIEREELVAMLSSTFVVEGFSLEELEDRADMVFNFLGKGKNDAISYEDFLRLSQSKNGLIFPVEEERHHLSGKDLSINALFAEARGEEPPPPATQGGM